ncbi:CPBP family intramembrane glutamic endopeptidase [Cellulophaga baltica]|uniref:CPBP family intramembrane glutamic endopeptidase n=1 Tax=Cellulophaga baltica TaxID=76594 RepID=UPI002495604E|nr:CPBP family intramembrane glutamic endopeptidase [Cellulophaga baltica]
MYIEQAYKGLKDSWRYVLGFIIVLIGWQILGMVPLLIAMAVHAVNGGGMVATIPQMAEAFGNNMFVFLMLISFAIGLLVLFLVVLFLHRQSITALTTSRAKIDWKRIFFAFTFWAVITILITGVDIYMSPDNYVWNFDVNKFLILAVIAICLVPLQTSFEEYLFRGYLMQSLGIFTKNRWIPLVVTSTIFGLMHIFNPEVQELGYGIMVYYIGTGFFLGILALMDEGLELSLGFHAANNLVTALLVTADWTAFQTDSMYRDVSEPALGWDVFIPVIVIYPALLFIFSKVYNWTNWKEKLTGSVLTEEAFLAQENNEFES